MSAVTSRNVEVSKKSPPSPSSVKQANGGIEGLKTQPKSPADTARPSSRKSSIDNHKPTTSPLKTSVVADKTSPRAGSTVGLSRLNSDPANSSNKLVRSTSSKSISVPKSPSPGKTGHSVKNTVSGSMSSLTKSIGKPGTEEKVLTESSGDADQQTGDQISDLAKELTNGELTKPVEVNISANNSDLENVSQKMEVKPEVVVSEAKGEPAESELVNQEAETPVADHPNGETNESSENNNIPLEDPAKASEHSEQNGGTVDIISQKKQTLVTSQGPVSVQKDTECTLEKKGEAIIERKMQDLKIKDKTGDVIAELKDVVEKEVEHDSSYASCSPNDESSSSPQKEAEVSKQSLRTKMWDHLEKENLVLFPLPCTGRIPNFKGAEEAAGKLIATDIFKNSKVIKVNPDKAQEGIRFHVLERGKRLLVPVPRLKTGLIHAIMPPEEADMGALRNAVQRFGMNRWGKQVDLDEEVHIDLVVLGSVLVDKKGHRIGKGEGYADLEFALMKEKKFVTDETVIVTTVHDEQVVDDIPEHILKEYDVPVDWIVTPTAIYEVEEKLSRPPGVMWKYLSNRRLMECPILQKLREEQMKEGQECELKEVDSDVEEKPRRPPQTRQYNRRMMNRRPRVDYSRSTGDPLRDTMQTPYSGRNRGGYGYQSRDVVNSGRMYNQGLMMNRQRRYNDGGYYNAQWSPYPRRNYDSGNYRPAFRRGSYPQNGGRGGSFNRQVRQRSTSSRRTSVRSTSGRRPASGTRVVRPRSVSARRQQSKSRQARSRSRRREHENSSSSSAAPAESRVDSADAQKIKRRNRSGVKRTKPPIAFSLRVKNIAPGVTVRDLKSVLFERGIKPRDITWKGYKGTAFLHFVKNPNTINDSANIDEIVRSLQGICLKPKPVEEDKYLVIEPTKPPARKPENGDLAPEIHTDV